MWQTIITILNNFKVVIIIGTLIFIFGLTGNITESIRSAKKGIKQSFTLLGFFVLVTILIIIYLIYLKVKALF